MVIEEIEDEYYQSSASSIPTALEDAVRAGNKVLVEYNAGAPSQRKAYLGTTCVVVYGKDAFIAQVEPARAIVVHEGEPFAFPAGAPRADADLAPLGLDLNLDVEVHRTPFKSGDTISLLTSGLAQLTLLTEDEYSQSYDDHTAAVEELYHMAVRNNLLDEHAVVIEGQAQPGRRPSVGASLPAMGREWLDRVSANLRRSRRPFILTQQKKDRDDAPPPAVGGAAAATWPLGGLGRSLPRALRPNFNLGGRGDRLQSMSLIVGVLILVLLSGALVLRAYQGYARGVRFESLLASAQQQRAAASGKPAKEALAHLGTAQAYVADARKIAPAHAQVAAETKLLAADWDAARKVVHLPKLSQLSVLQGYKDNGSAKLVVVGSNALVLSKPSGAAYVYDLKNRKAVKLTPKKATHFTGLSWRTDGVLLLDQTGKVHDYDLISGEWTTVQLGGKQQWTKVSAFDTYGTTAYIGFQGKPGLTIYNMSKPKTAQTMTLGDKGQPVIPAGLSAAKSQWLISSQDDSLLQITDDKVARRLWVEAEPPLQQVHSLTAIDENKYLYMLDKQRNRVLQVTDTGQLVSQFQFGTGVKPIGGLDALYADESRRMMYMIVGNKLYSASIPNLPRR